jgi:hypothetical protein
MAMSAAARGPLTQARRVEGFVGLLASVYGLIAFGVVTFAPQVAVYNSPGGVEVGTGFSVWDELFVFSTSPAAQATAVGAWLLCLLCLIAVGTSAYAHAVQQAVGGRRWLVLATAVLTVELTFAPGVAYINGYSAALAPLHIMAPFASPLLPALVLAALASGVAVTR